LKIMPGFLKRMTTQWGVLASLTGQGNGHAIDLEAPAGGVLI
jgi:hypothetical protein